MKKGKQVSIDSHRKKSDTDLAQFAGTLHNVPAQCTKFPFNVVVNIEHQKLSTFIIMLQLNSFIWMKGFGSFLLR